MKKNNSKNSDNSSYSEIAQLMLQKLEKDGILYQNEISFLLFEEYNNKATYINANGNIAINRNILNAFRRITKGRVIWIKAEKCWRFRKDYDSLSSREVDY